MTTAMASAVATPLAAIFATNDELASRALDGLTPQQLWEAPTDRNNAMLWIAGHLVQTRAQLLGVLGNRSIPAGEIDSTAGPWWATPMAIPSGRRSNA